jgi:hypothetical protein
MVLVVLLFAGYRHLRLQQHALSPAGEANLEDDGAVILPTVSPAWSNVNGRVSRKNFTGLETNAANLEDVEATNETATADVSLDAVDARAKDLLARAALGGVGVDPDAEQFWLAAINDPSIAAEERQDLITSLEQAGLADPRRITPDDLPLIAGRIALIEEIAPDAMDSVNAAAFQDTYRNLVAIFGNIIATERAPEQEGTGE